MKATELIAKLETLIQLHGDREVKIVGVFNQAVNSDFDIKDGSEYELEGFFGSDYSDIGECFLIDESEEVIPKADGKCPHCGGRAYQKFLDWGDDELSGYAYVCDSCMKLLDDSEVEHDG